jgi:Ca2+-binding RTX toxin-like protein
LTDLATLSDSGDLRLNMGKFADQRLNGDLTDIGENFTVTHAGGTAGDETIHVSSTLPDSKTLTFEHVKKVVADGGEGIDTITMNGIQSPMEISGGAGDDTINLTGSTGNAVIHGDAGDDTITGGAGNDVIYGGLGTDHIYGGAGNDIIFGDDGSLSDTFAEVELAANDSKDYLYGQGGADIIFGGGGDDELWGDDTSEAGTDGSDILIGDAGLVALTNGLDTWSIDWSKGVSDTMSAKTGGKDKLYGGGGVDYLFGGAGDDELYGGSGADRIFGEAGFDKIYGDAQVAAVTDGDDVIFGDSWTLAGTARLNDAYPALGLQPTSGGEADHIYGGGGKDYIYGGGGNDYLRGDAGDDYIYGGSGADEIYGDSDVKIDADHVSETGNDGADHIYGGSENDIIFAGGGNDVIRGEAGNDYVRGGGDKDTVYAGIGWDNLDGQAGSDTYVIYYRGGETGTNADNDNVRNVVVDSGTDPLDTDVMKVYGTVKNDTFLLRASSDKVNGRAFVALLNTTAKGQVRVERTDYRNIERLIVNGDLGDDYFAIDDTWAETTINGDLGKDTFQVGQLYRTPRISADYPDSTNPIFLKSVDPGNEFATIETTRGWLSNGTSQPMTINGGEDDDLFVVFHNKAVLALNGEGGDDTFIIRAFALTGSQEPIRGRTDITGGAGADLIQYVINCPVNIDGGDGFDTVIVIGTEFSDDIVVTKDGVFGAGLNVNFVNIESLTVDGAEGDDRFFVLSTSNEFLTQIFGGLGSDTFNMSGPTPPVVSNDLRGHSGIITHEATGGIYTDVAIEGISANVYDNDGTQPQVVITQTHLTLVEGGAAATYTISLSKQPTDDVFIKVLAPLQTPTEEELKSRAFRVWSNDASSYNEPDGTATTLKFSKNSGDPNGWNTPQVVNVQASGTGVDAQGNTIDYNDSAIEGIRNGAINQMVSVSAPLSVTLDSVENSGADKAILRDNDASSGSGFPVDPVTNIGKLQGCIVVITDGVGAGQQKVILDNTATTLTLDGPWGIVPSNGSHYEVITPNGTVAPSVLVKIYDDDAPAVMVTESDGISQVIEGSTYTLKDGFASDTVEISLTRLPRGAVTVGLDGGGQLAFFDSSNNPITSLSFTSTAAQTVTIKAIVDGQREGLHHGQISFTVSSTADTDEIRTVSSPDVFTVSADEPKGYVGLSHRPLLDQVVTVTVSTLNGGNPLTRDADYRVVSNKVIFLDEKGEVKEVTGTVTVNYSYRDPGYNGINVTPVIVDIGDADTPGVRVTQSGGTTDVVEGAAWSDSYEVVLTRDPGEGVDVYLDATPIPTKTSTGKVVHKEVQVNVGSSQLHFTHANWFEPQSVTVTAVDDHFVDGDDTQVFAQMPATLDNIQGPIIVDGAGGQGSMTGLGEPLMLPGEKNVKPSTGAIQDRTSTTLTVLTQDLLKDKGIQDALVKLGIPLEEQDANDLALLIDARTVEITVGAALGQFRLMTGLSNQEDGTTVLTLNAPYVLNKGETLADLKEYAITKQSLTFFVNEDEQIDYLVASATGSPADNTGLRAGKITSTNISGLGMGVDTFIGDRLFTGGITYGNMEVLEVNLGAGDDSLTVASTHNRLTFDEAGKATSTFRNWTMVNTGAGNDIVTISLHPDTVTTSSGTITTPDTISFTDSAANFGADNNLRGLLVKVVNYKSDGMQSTYFRRVVTNTMHTVTVNKPWDEPLGTGSIYEIINEGDGAFALDTQAGNDIIHAETSSLGVTLFGGTGDDQIWGGSGDDIIFGDKGRVDYFNERGEVVTRLGETPATIITGHIGGTGSEDGCAYMDDLTHLDFWDQPGQPFRTPPFDKDGLTGLIVETNDGDGWGQRRLITGNTADRLYINEPWGTGPIDGLPVNTTPGDHQTMYIIYARPENQTDGVFRDPSLMISIDPGTGGMDQIYSGGGNDTVIGGASVDSVWAGSGDDTVFGDNARIDLTKPTGNVAHQGETVDTTIVRMQTTDPTIGGADTVYGDSDNDIILGGYNPGGTGQEDKLYGNTGNDIILGDNGMLNFSPKTWTEDPRDVALDSIETIALDTGGTDIISGNADNDILIGGTAGDMLYGDNASASASMNDGSDILIGDNGQVVYAAGIITRILTTDTSETTGGADTISGNAAGDYILGGVNGGGVNGDTIYGDAATPGANDNGDVILGDNGRLDFNYKEDAFGNAISGGDGNLATLDLILSVDNATLGGADTISGNAGSDKIIGGTSGDTIYGNNAAATADASDGADYLIGDNGKIYMVAGSVSYMQTTDTAESTGGVDTISGNAAGDYILGGVNGDTIYGDAATPGANDNGDVILGDNGRLDFGLDSGSPDYRTLDLILSFNSATLGGADTISGNAGSDKIIGGSAGDTLYGDNASAAAGATDGRDYLIGDNGRIDLINGLVTVMQTTDTTESTGGADTISGNAAGDCILGGVNGGGVNGDTIYGDAATPGANDNGDVILGDNGRFDFNLGGVPYDGDPMTLDRVRTADTNLGGIDTIYGNAKDDVILGGAAGDFIYGNTGNDLVLGDFGEVRFSSVAVNKLGTSTAYKEYPLYATTMDDSQGGTDTIFGNEDEDVLAGGAFGDNIDGGSGDDLVFGDNVTLDRHTPAIYNDFTNPRFRTATGAIYDANGNVAVGAADQNYPSPMGTPVWANWDITLLDHDAATEAAKGSNFGNDYIAGGPDDDMIFGQLGNDTIQGDGSITSKLVQNPVTAYRNPDGTLTVVPSFEASTDGDDYIEGNGGNDVIFGNLGQDDIIGGSSSLFSLNTPAKRPDGSDLIFGGAGTDIARNHLGDTSPTGHARDADMILGDNGNIFRLVSANGTTTSYLTFNYDNYSSTLKIIPRAAQLLDYTPGGPDYNPTQAANDIGAADEIHGESGDDFIYGMKGNDVLFGEGQDDDTIGGYGNDWISGGTGDDGILGDDGRIFTSRNGTTEPLNGVTVAVQPSTIATGGNVQLANINVAGQLKKSVDLTPFSTDPSWNPATDEWGSLTRKNSDDIIFGGLGNDFLHGGSGDDAISGAEALPVSYSPTYDAAGNPSSLVEIDYNHPFNPGNVLAFNPIDVNGQHANRTRAGEFSLYDEYDPLRKILLNSNGSASKWTGAPTGVEFFLNFDATEGPAAALDATKKTDGDDKIFGDLGNDWLVGGSGRDDMYGGFGNDLLNADDDLTTNGSLNNLPDTSASYEDRAFGSAGRDVLIANTGGDRLIDWTGEYNSYLVPFSPFGMATVSRTLQPALQDFLYALSASDGADPTRAADATAAGQSADAARNGEPWGELGLVLQKDAAWHDQHGGPSDPQAGNLSGTQRDVLRSANFNTGTAQGFVPQVGTFSIVNNRYQVAPSTPYGDAISLFNEADTVIPIYFEMQATINAVKPTGGVWANAYLIFDWQSNTDFKFAGINVSNNKLELGHYTAGAWVVDTWTNYQLKPATDYVVMLKANGSAATLTLGNTSISFTYAQRVDSLGVKHGLNDGMAGIGTKGGTQAQIDDVVVQAPPGVITLDKTVDFGSTSPASGLFNSTTPATGTWATTTDGRFLGTAADAANPAINLIGYTVTPGSLIDIATTLKTSGQGGVVFDYQGPTYYKFVTLSADSKQIIIGHRNGATTTIDKTYSTTVASGTDYKLGVILRGGLVNVSLNGAVVVSCLYNETITVGGYGFISMKGATSGQTSFDIVRLKTDDAAYAVPVPLMATAPSQESAGAQNTLTNSELAPIIQEAINRWTNSPLGGESALALLDNVTFTIADLPGLTLGEAIGNTVLIDTDAAGYGWFIDPTPHDDTEFKPQGRGGELVALTSSPAFGDMDLLTVVMHELGHVLGFADVNPQTQTLMSATLSTGERHAAVNANSQTQESSPKLVVMESADPVASIPTAMEQAKSLWLTNFLVNSAQNSYNAFNANDEIRIKISGDDEPDTSSILRRLYGKGKRA